MTSDFNQVIKRRWRFELPELPISRPVTRQAPKTPKCKNKLNEYALNVHDYSRPVTHHQVKTCNKPTTAKQEVFNVGGVNVIDYQFLIPKRFESGDYKVCLGYNIKNPPAKEGYYQDGYVIPWKTPEVIVKPKFQYLKKKSQNQRLVKTPAIKFARLEEEDGNKDEKVDVNSISVEYVEAGTAGQAEHVSLDDADMEHMQLGHSRNEYVQSGNVKGRNLKGETIKAGNIKEGAMKGVLNGQNGTSENLISGNVREVFGKLGNGKGEHTKVDNHVEFDLSDAQFRREDTFLPMIPATPKIKPRKKLQRDYSVPKFDDILVDKVVARQKAKEMAEKQKQLIANALKHYADNFKEQNLFVDMNVISQLKENVRDALLNEHVSPKSRQMIFKSILEGNDLENILNIAPEMSRPINEFDDLAERDAVMMYKLPTPQHAEETFIPETYRRKLSSTIKVQHKTLVPTRKAAKKEELKHSEEQGNTSKFFRDFQTLLDRQHKIEGEAVAMIGNIQTHLETRQIARYPIEDLLKLIWHQYCHLKDSYEEIVPTEVAQAFYTRLRN
ncbi:hypothetical protein HK103_001214 [Boothiomyces macroporosus]|uniref:Uncharacterized protein n=1 Tax=Boothiomyces macroporosus TaxID=261099 RepID=A0AAD5Y5L9_9FUNG|nr:hypothetical protein HK103_001214 [Boothiomyces macroporosus]